MLAKIIKKRIIFESLITSSSEKDNPQVIRKAYANRSDMKVLTANESGLISFIRKENKQIIRRSIKVKKYGIFISLSLEMIKINEINIKMNRCLDPAGIGIPRF